MSRRRLVALILVLALVGAAEAGGSAVALRDNPRPSPAPQLAEDDAKAALQAYGYLHDEAIKVTDRDTLLQGGWEHALASAKLSSETAPRSTASDAAAAIRADLAYLVEHNHGRLSPSLLAESYITGMAKASGDPHTSYIPANLLASVRGSETEDNQLFYGVSAVDEPGGQRVWEVIPGSPAAHAGLKAGDLILKTESASAGKDSPALNRDLSQALTVRRDGRTFRFIVRPEFADVPIATTRSLGNDIDYLRVYSFNVSEDKFKEGLDPVWDQLKGTRLILDLRSNPGGAIANLAELAGKLGYRGPLLTAIDRHGFRRRVDAERSASVPYRPQEIVVLVDSGTYSAGEILSSILQQAGSPVLGTQTKGYAHGSLVLAIGNGALQIGLYRNLVGSKMIDLEGVGVTPDGAVELDYQRLKKGDDNVIAQAVELLGSNGTR